MCNSKNYSPVGVLKCLLRPAATFSRLADLIAIDNVADRPTKSITEVFTGKELATIPVGTRRRRTCGPSHRARVAQKEWAKRSVLDRAAVFHRYRDLILENRDALMDMAQAETGKSRTAAQEEVLDISMTSRHYARVAPKLLRPRRVSGMLPGLTKTVVRYQPKGVVGVISPWNYPMTLAVSDAIAALLAGNAVVLKPDSQTPYCRARLRRTALQGRVCLATSSPWFPGRAPSSAPPWSRTPTYPHVHWFHRDRSAPRASRPAVD